MEKNRIKKKGNMKRNLKWRERVKMKERQENNRN